MDPLSQGVFGAAVAGSSATRDRITPIVIIGGLSALAPDLDFLIRSSTDTLMFLEYHRQFSHSIAFIPIGAAICALLSYPFVRRHLSWRLAYVACLLGYASHGLLDACTSYGTQLFWPFSDARVAWNSVSVVDPLFTVPLLVLTAAAIGKQRPVLARAALVWAVLYLGLGVVQQQRAMSAGFELAASRGHEPVRLDAKPSFANLLVWKIIYEHDGHYFVDAARLAGTVSYCAGQSVAALDLKRDFPWLGVDTQQARDVERFRWFSEDYLAVDPADPMRIVDVRYSTLPNEIEPLWGIQLDPRVSSTTHADFMTQSTRRADQLPQLLAMVGDSYPCSGNPIDVRFVRPT